LWQRIEELLRYHREDTTFLNVPVMEQLAAERSLDFLGPPAEPGFLGRLDQYEVLEAVGCGGTEGGVKAPGPNSADRDTNGGRAGRGARPGTGSPVMTTARFLWRQRCWPRVWSAGMSPWESGEFGGSAPTWFSGVRPCSWCLSRTRLSLFWS